VGWTAKDVRFDSRHWISACFLCAHSGSDVNLGSYNEQGDLPSRVK